MSFMPSFLSSESENTSACASPISLLHLFSLSRCFSLLFLFFLVLTVFFPQVLCQSFASIPFFYVSVNVKLFVCVSYIKQFFNTGSNFHLITPLSLCHLSCVPFFSLQ